MDNFFSIARQKQEIADPHPHRKGEVKHKGGS